MLGFRCFLGFPLVAVSGDHSLVAVSGDHSLAAMSGGHALVAVSGLLTAAASLAAEH